MKHAHSGDSIDIVAGTYVENIRIGKNSKKGEKISVSINGAGPGSTIIDGGAKGTVVSISQAAVLLTGVTIQNGSASGIAVHDGTLAVSNCIVTNNKATGSGGGIDFEVSNHPPKGTPQLHIDNTTISDNITNAFGGGLAINGGSSNIITSTISGNSSIGGNGGGVEIFSGEIAIANSTIIGNQATGGEPMGGGINCIGTLVLNNVTIANNSASTGIGKGGGLFSLGCSAAIANTIIAGNSAFYGDQNDCGGNLNSQGHNLIDYNGCVTSGDTATNIIGEDAMLGPLELNSPGATGTQALLMGSPAIGAGAPGANDSTGAGPQCLPTDQRGVTRPTDACDIGAYQFSM
ncbi:MAG TPA: choice-of-anchor Q domain-containing protein [Candidatus Binatus sp.]|uniref:choice-of-anchor Q domain-containing protein n=1 Tax=Candidatus Binatus sp. TaxID=2811406 RepID=UPI002F40960C